MRPLSDFCCINIECSEHGNLVPPSNGRMVGKTYEFIRHMGNQTQSGCWNAKYVDISSQKEPTPLYQRVVFPEKRSYPYFITWLKAVDSDGSAVWWE